MFIIKQIHLIIAASAEINVEALRFSLVVIGIMGDDRECFIVLADAAESVDIVNLCFALDFSIHIVKHSVPFERIIAL